MVHIDRDDRIILNGIIFYLSNSCVPGGSLLPWWDVKGVLISVLVLYYWLHRALHRHHLYARYHSHHHASIVTEPISCKYHSLHHTQFRTSCCLFMPFHDYIYGTVDMSTEKLYKNSLKGKEETPDVVDLTHLTTLQSIYHLRIGLSSLASKPFVPRVHLLLAWPLSYAVLLLTCISASASTLERHRIVDGSRLAAAAVLHSIPAGTDRVLLRGKPFKTTCAIALALCQRGTKVIAVPREEFVALKLCVATNVAAHLVLSDDYTPKVWLVGEGLTDQDQRKASSGTCFIPFSQFPVKKAHEDCTYQMTPAMAVPRTLEIMHTVMSAWRIAGIVHALEEWDMHECGGTMNDMDKVWRAALNHGFLPLVPIKWHYIRRDAPHKNVCMHGVFKLVEKTCDHHTTLE
ncbi:WAX2 C-terminal domain [Musa troglodytarum]|uniref:WAX2 C-terminal domain n=1 Tax=Musa troglodytarum TaxID=320322 RepID=A0A9E7EI80_9LILI|nr:WAX2 C-terminal domain [Musa troglodytarum]